MSAWLYSHVISTGKCAKIFQRTKDHIDRMVQKMENKIPENNLRDCPAGTCVGDVCVYDLNGDFGGDGKVLGRTNKVHDDVIEFGNIQFANADRFRSPVAKNDFARYVFKFQFFYTGLFLVKI